MSAVEPILLNFNAGELSPLMNGRVDTAIRQSGCETLLNGLPLRTGPVTRRPGTRFVTTAKSTGDGVWLIDFVFNRTQSYVLEIGPGYMRFFTQGGVLLDNGAPYEVAHGWTDIEDFTDEEGRCRLDVTSRGDRMWIVNGRRPPMIVSRLAATDWTVEDMAAQDGPFLPENTTDITISADATTGAVTLTASEPLFRTSHIGGLLRLFSPNLASVQPWRSGEAVTTGQQRRNDGRVYVADNDATTSTIPPTHEEGTATDGAVNWTFLHPQFGVLEITGVTPFAAQTTASATVLARLPDECTGAGSTARFAFGAWSAFGQWPVAVSFFRERLTFAGGRFVWQSRSRDYASFADRTTAIEQLADDGITVELVADFPVDIQWASPSRDVLLLGCTQGELALTTLTDNEPYGPTNVTQNPVTDFGAAKLRPVRAADQRLLFLQAAGRTVIELADRIDQLQITGRDLGIFAEHILGEGILDWAWQQRPDGMLWCRTARDGLVAMTYSPDQDIVAWHRHDLGGGGRVQALRVIPRSTHDELWLMVERGEGANTVRSIERMEERWRFGTQVEDYFGVDSGLSIDSEDELTSLVGLEHLEGRQVIGLTDGANHPPVTVTDGSIRLAWPARKCHFGLPFVTDISPMSIEYQTRRGSIQGQKKRVQAVVARLLEALVFKMGSSPDRLQLITLRSPRTPLGSPEAPVTGDFAMTDFPGDWNRIERIYARMDGAGPGTLICLMPQIESSR